MGPKSLLHMTQDLPVQSTQKAFQIIEELVKEGELSVREVTDRVDMPKTTVHAHLRTMEQLGYLINDGEKYRTSTKFVALGTLTRTRMGLFNITKDKIDELAENTGEQASIGIAEGFRTVTLYTAKGEKALDIEPFDGQRFPMHTIAAGKAMLAHFSDERVEQYIQQNGLEKKTENTCTDPDILRNELAQIAKQGYAVDAEEHNEGLSGIAVPILDEQEVKGAVNLFGPTSRIRVEEFEKDGPLGKELFETANIIEVNLRYM